MTNSTSITIKPGTLSLNHLFEIYRARPTVCSPTTHMREWSNHAQSSNVSRLLGKRCVAAHG
jgi:hypothetical protein